MMKKNGRLQLRIDKTLLERARKAARQRGMSLSFVVEQRLRDLVEEQKSKTTDDDGVRQV